MQGYLATAYDTRERRPQNQGHKAAAAEEVENFFLRKKLGGHTQTRLKKVFACEERKNFFREILMDIGPAFLAFLAS